MALSCSQKIICIIKKNNIKTSWWFLLFEFFFHSFREDYSLKSHEKFCKNKDFCGIVMSSEKDNILEFNQCMNSNEIPDIIMLILNWMCK